MVWLPDGEKTFEDMCIRFDRIPACDRQTDKRTDGQPGQCLRLLVSLAGSVYLLKACA